MVFVWLHEKNIAADSKLYLMFQGVVQDAYDRRLNARNG